LRIGHESVRPILPIVAVWAYPSLLCRYQNAFAIQVGIVGTVAASAREGMEVTESLKLVQHGDLFRRKWRVNDAA
jgi:hypothetical protein